MLVIPELKKVVIMPPRSGSTALKRTVLDTYKEAFSPWRHGEYMMYHVYNYMMDNGKHKDYTPVYMLRHPVDRLVSLWRYMQDVSPERNPRAPMSWINRVRKDASRPFSDWLFSSSEYFNESSATPGDGSPESYYCTYYQLPAVMKSADIFLRGAPATEIVPFGNRARYNSVLGIDIPEQKNASTPREANVSEFDRQWIENNHWLDMQMWRNEYE